MVRLRFPLRQGHGRERHRPSVAGVVGSLWLWLDGWPATRIGVHPAAWFGALALVLGAAVALTAGPRWGNHSPVFLLASITFAIACLMQVSRAPETVHFLVIVVVLAGALLGHTATFLAAVVSIGVPSGG